MTKVQKKKKKISAFGGIFSVLDKFDRILSSVIDSHLGLRSKLIGYQYSEIIRAVFSVFCCGGNCMEDLNLYLKDVLTERPHTRVPSADMVLRGIEELATENKNHRDRFEVNPESWTQLKGSLQTCPCDSRKRYYEYHSGYRPLPPDHEQYIRQAILRYGWTEPIDFNAYVEDYLW